MCHLVVSGLAQPDQRLLRLGRRPLAPQQHHRVVELGQPVALLRRRRKPLQRGIEPPGLVGTDGIARLRLRGRRRLGGGPHRRGMGHGPHEYDQNHARQDGSSGLANRDKGGRHDVTPANGGRTERGATNSV
ncbi:hypothetical protein D3C72_1666420 [compost metagenome]